MITVSVDNNKVVLMVDSQEDCHAIEQTVGTLLTFNGKFYECPIENLDELNANIGKVTKLGVVFKVTDIFKKWIKDNNIKAPVYISMGPCFCRIKYKDMASLPLADLDKETSFFFKPAVNMKKYKEKMWDGIIHLLDKNHMSFPTGLFPRVEHVLKSHGHRVVVKKLYNDSPEREFDWKPNNDITPDPDQFEAIENAIASKRGIIKAATGFGKTAVLSRWITAELGQYTLFLANKKSLLDDAKEEFINGINGLEAHQVGQIKDGIFGNTKIKSDTADVSENALDFHIIVATIQSMDARLKDKRTRKILLHWMQKKCKVVIVDETQAVGTMIWDTVLNNIYAPYRFCLSATPRRTDGATLKIEAASGPWIFQTSADEQIKKGRLSDVRIEYHYYDHKLYNTSDGDINYNDMYTTAIVENQERNAIVVKHALDMVSEGRHVLVLIQRIEHGHILRQEIVNAGIDPDDVRFVWGDTPDKIRTAAIKEFKKGDFKIMVGSTIFDAGVNVPIISGVVLAGAGNSDITLVQRIGRGTRTADYEKILGYIPEFMLKEDGKKITRVVDFVDANIKFFHRQSLNRYRNAADEFGSERVFMIGASSKEAFKVYGKKKQSLKQIFTEADEALLSMLGDFAE